MPYISREERVKLDDYIDQIVQAIASADEGLNNPHDLSNHLGRINYCFSRIVGQLMGGPSYKKIAMITGVLENIKQEFYRRIALPYEEYKISENGDIKEYV
jgi:hypothetical protein